MKKGIVKTTQTHIVIKVEDLKYLDKAQKTEVGRILKRIKESREKAGKKPYNEYLIVNKDEPYAGLIQELILLFEGMKSEIEEMSKDIHYQYGKR